MFLDLLGYPDADSIPHWRDISTDEAFIAQCLNALRDVGASKPCETTLRAADGSHVPVMVSGTVLERHPDGTTDIAAYVTDLR